MKTVYSTDHRQHDVETEILNGGEVPCFERPARAEAVIDRIRQENTGEVLSPREHGLKPVLQIHSDAYVTFLEQAWSLWQDEYGPTGQALPSCFPNRSSVTNVPEHIQGKLGFYTFDLSAAITPGTWQAVRTSANIALTGVDLILAGETSVPSTGSPRFF